MKSEIYVLDKKIGKITKKKEKTKKKRETKISVS